MTNLVAHRDQSTNLQDFISRLLDDGFDVFEFNSLMELAKWLES